MSTSLVKRDPFAIAGQAIKTPEQFADLVREMQSQAHILSPAVAISRIPDHYVINTAVVVIDPTSADVYAGSFHKKTKRGDDWIPTEVSISKTGLLKILSAAGVHVTYSDRVDDGKTMHYWRWRCEGTITDFDGQIRPLPPGNEEVDLRDGSAQIGGWTPEEWVKREAAADERKANTPEKERWKVKPEPIDGWSRDRVMGQRAKGLNIAAAKAMNSLIRNLGVKQKYSIEELKKPFVIFRATFMPNMNNPRVEEMVTAAHLGATHLLYGRGAPSEPRQIAGDVIDVHATSPDEPPVEQPQTAAAPQDAVELDDIPEPKPAAPATPPSAEPTYHVTKASKLTIDGVDHYFFATAQLVTFVTTDIDVARQLNAARKSTAALSIEAEPTTIGDKRYQRVIESKLAPSGASAQQQGSLLPDPSKL